MKWILPDWDDAACVELLGACRHAIDPRSRLLATEWYGSDRSDELDYAWICRCSSR
jgi:hypothetical protein